MITRNIILILIIFVPQMQFQLAYADTVISGTLDTYIEKTIVPGQSAVQLDSSGLGVSKFTVKSTESLDAETVVFSRLEGSINVDTGVGGEPEGLFDRMAYIGIQKQDIKITLGKQFSPHLLQLGGEFDIFATSFWGTPFAIFQAGTRYILIPKALAIQGTFLQEKNLTVSVMLANRNDQTELRPPGKQLFLSGMYEINKELHVGISEVRDHSFSYSNPQMTLTLIGLNYDTGKIRFSGGIQTLGFQHNVARVNEYCSGVGYWINSFNQIQFSYGKTFQTDAAQNFSAVYGIAITHHLSKRTAIYVSVARLKNGKGYNTYFDLPLLEGETANNLMFGVRHNF